MIPLSVPGVGVEGAGCERTHLLFSTSAAVLWQHLLRSVGPQAGHQRGGCVGAASLSHPHHTEGDQGDAETTVVQSTAFFCFLSCHSVTSFNYKTSVISCIIGDAWVTKLLSHVEISIGFNVWVNDNDVNRCVLWWGSWNPVETVEYIRHLENKYHECHYFNKVIEVIPLLSHFHQGKSEPATFPNIGDVLVTGSLCYCLLANIRGGREGLRWDLGQGKGDESWWPRPRGPPDPQRAGSHQQHGRRGEGGGFLSNHPHIRTAKRFTVMSAPSACVRRWRRSRSSNWSMINTVKSWWDLERSLATSHPSPASSRCSLSSPTPSWACWATARLRASWASEPLRCRPRARWWRADTAVSWWRSDLTRWSALVFPTYQGSSKSSPAADRK